jgi:hypothetical protein
LATIWVSAQSDVWLKVRGIFSGSPSETP